MSADRWSVCPKCYKDRSLVTREEKLEELYGTIPAEEFLKLSKTLKDDEPLEEFREDYEFYLDGKILRMSYSGRCQANNCGLRYTFKKNVDILTNEEVGEFNS